MQTWIVFGVYGGSVMLALFVLYIFRRTAWYLHLLALILALALGFTPLPAGWQGRQTDLIVGSVFLFLAVWGVFAPLFGKRKAQARRI